MPEISENDIVYQATMNALAGTRKLLLVISGLIGLFIFHMFLFYFTWDFARIDARHGVIESIRDYHKRGKLYEKSLKADDDLAAEMVREINSIEVKSIDKQYDLPLVGMKFSGADFSVAILILAAAVLLWLLFYQRRLAACLVRLAELRGWKVVISALQYHFVLIGEHASRDTRIAVRGLIWGLPCIGVLQVGSDVFDFISFKISRVQELAFHNERFLLRVVLRMGVDLALVGVVAWLAWKCYREYIATEAKLTSPLAEMSPTGTLN
jgi:hypothetical protein